MKKILLLAFILSGRLVAQVTPALEIKNIHTGYPAVKAIAFSPDGKYVASGGIGGKIVVYDISDQATARNVGYISVNSSVNSLEFSPDGRYIVSGSDNDLVQFWDSPSGNSQVASYNCSGDVGSIKFSPNGKQLIVGGGDVLYVYDSGTLIKTIEMPMKITNVCYSPDGKKVAAGTSVGDIKVWNTSNWSLSLEKTLSSKVTGLQFNTDGSRLFATASAGDLNILDATTGKAIHLINVDNNTYMYSCAVSPNGKKVVVGTLSGKVHMWDTYTGQHLETYTGTNSNSLSAVAFSKDGTTMAAGCFDNGIALWTVAEASQSSSTVSNCTKLKMDEWLIKGEYEKTVDYNARTSAENRTKKEDEFKSKCGDDFASKYISALKWDFAIGNYDADSETFPLTSASMGNFKLHVPINEAKSFKEKWGRYEYVDIIYNFVTVGGEDVFMLNGFSLKDNQTGNRYKCKEY